MTYDDWKTRSPDDERWYDQPDDRFEIITCRACSGEGHTLRTIHVYEAGCGFSHPDVEEIRCEVCDGKGEFIEEYEIDDGLPRLKHFEEEISF